MSGPTTHDPTCDLCAGRGYISDGQTEDGRMTGRKDCPGYGWRRIPEPPEVSAERYHKHGPSSDPYDVEQRAMRRGHLT